MNMPIVYHPLLLNEKLLSDRLLEECKNTLSGYGQINFWTIMMASWLQCSALEPKTGH
jgi:hypothetical protein